MDLRQKFLFKYRIIEETSPCACENNARSFSGDAKPFLRSSFVTADNDHRTRTHVLFFANHGWNPMIAIIAKCCGWML
jgi:hypothetical protein